MFSIAFVKAAAERCIRAAAFAFLATVGVGQFAFNEIDWLRALSVAGVAGIFSAITSLTVNSATGTGPAVLDSEQTVAKDEVVVPIEVFTNQ